MDREGVEEMAAFAGVQARFLPLPHDVMLDSKWQQTADIILQWLDGLE